jgi:hypothetical protein
MRIPKPRAPRSPRHWVARLARFGYAAEGLIYVIVGVLAMLAAYDVHKRPTGSHGALETLLSQPFGVVLLGAVAAGLTAYVIWCFAQAILDTERQGRGVRGFAVRMGYALVGLVNAGLAYSAALLIVGLRTSGDDRAARDWTAALLAQPFGPWLAGIVGASIIVFGLYQFNYASTTRFCRELYMDELSATAEFCITRLGQLGLVARGIVVILIGSFLVHAALEFDTNAARGLRGTLRTLEQQPFGPWALGGVALGLTAYGIYMLVEAWYRRIVIT